MLDVATMQQYFSWPNMQIYIQYNCIYNLYTVQCILYILYSIWGLKLKDSKEPFSPGGQIQQAKTEMRWGVISIS